MTKLRAYPSSHTSGSIQDPLKISYSCLLLQITKYFQTVAQMLPCFFRELWNVFLMKTQMAQIFKTWKCNLLMPEFIMGIGNHNFVETNLECEPLYDIF